jgi:hypothetical protein
MSDFDVKKVNAASSAQGAVQTDAASGQQETPKVAKGKVQPPAKGAYFGVWLGVAPSDTEVNVRIPLTDAFVWSSRSLANFRIAEQKFGKLTGKSPAILTMYQQWSDTKKFNDFPDAFVHACDSMWTPWPPCRHSVPWGSRSRTTASR